MKSERAMNHLLELERIFGQPSNVGAWMAVIMAEEDARNRAIKAFKAAVIGVTEQSIECFLKALDYADK